LRQSKGILQENFCVAFHGPHRSRSLPIWQGTATDQRRLPLPRARR
jgi:hypothetical protein